jgi:hypothetical protein
MIGQRLARFTCDGRDAHAAVALDEHVHGVLEHVWPQQQRRDVVEHDPCTRAPVGRAREQTVRSCVCTRHRRRIRCIASRWRARGFGVDGTITIEC